MVKVNCFHINITPGVVLSLNVLSIPRTGQDFWLGIGETVPEFTPYYPSRLLYLIFVNIGNLPFSDFTLITFTRHNLEFILI